VSTELLFDITTFVLAVLVGFEVISKVPATLHTPLMSGANSIHGVVVIGALMVTSTASGVFGYTIAFVAVAFAAMNVVGGYAVTDRMLEMFKAKPMARPEAPPELAPAAPPESAAPSQTVHTVDAGTTR
jgi:NAD(P) transhydrogenase subunit alpha